MFLVGFKVRLLRKGGKPCFILPGKGSSLFPGRYSGKSVDPPENVCGKGTSGAEGTDCGYQH